MNRPIIGVVPLVDIEKDSYWMLPGYMEGIIAAGGLPVMLPLTSDQEVLAQLATTYDGFLFTGGHDIAPEIYGEETLPDCGPCCQERDEMEQGLFAIAYELDKPVLGICRGLQIINGILGGTLYQDLPSQRQSNVRHQQSPPYDKPIHEVKLVENTPLYTLLKQGTISVNSYHHQGIKTLAPPLRAMAYAEDGLIEAIYAKGKKYIQAVQWHPEFSFLQDNNSREIFKSFIRVMG